VGWGSGGRQRGAWGGGRGGGMGVSLGVGIARHTCLLSKAPNSPSAPAGCFCKHRLYAPEADSRNENLPSGIDAGITECYQQRERERE